MFERVPRDPAKQPARRRTGMHPTTTPGLFNCRLSPAPATGHPCGTDDNHFLIPWLSQHSKRN
eukprot:399252-Alexandrium_andersonii.AAC.1